LLGVWLRGHDRPRLADLSHVRRHFMGANELEPVRKSRDAASLEPEDLLDLVPDGEQQEQREPDQQCKRDEEAQPSVFLLTLASQPRVPPSPVIVVRPIDRLGIDGRFFGRRCNVPSGWLGHPGSLVGLWPAVLPAE
jgi:hypothetical protein